MNMALHNSYMSSERYDNEDVNISSQVGRRIIKKKVKVKGLGNDQGLWAGPIFQMGR